MNLDVQTRQELEKKFIIGTLLGRGSFGDVFECEDKRDKLKYAVKVVSKVNVKRSKIESLREEAKLLQSFNHSNIVKIHQFVEEETCVFIRMELARRGNLKNLIEMRYQNELSFSDEQIAKIILQLFKGVSYIHSLSIIHRDIKPENILVQGDHQLEIKIADFGLSTKLDSHYPKSAIIKCGTVAYMAPEILCKYTYTRAIDVWAVAVTMYILFTGKHPLFKQNMLVEDFKTLMAKRPIFPDLPNKQGTEQRRLAQNLLCKISKVQPHERYTAQESLKHPWLTRNFYDPVPLSIQQSYDGFSKSHEVVNAVKSILVLKFFRNITTTTVPSEYLAKIYQRQDSPQKPKKLMSIQEVSPGTVIMKASPEKRAHRNSFDDRDNPTIVRLNEIFNNLFDRKVSHKKPMEVPQEAPNVETFKSRIELQIKQAVEDCLQIRRNKNRRILPTRQSERIIQQQREEELAGMKKNVSSCRKSRYRKRLSDMIKGSVID